MNEKIRKTILYFLNNVGKHASYVDIIKYLKEEIEEFDEKGVDEALADLIKKNKIISHLSVNKKKRYEAEVRRHYHFICNNCGSVKDIFMEQGAVNMLADHAQKIAKSFARVDRVNMSFQGACYQCQAK